MEIITRVLIYSWMLFLFFYFRTEGAILSSGNFFIFLLISIIFSLSLIILSLKDIFLKKRGLREKENRRLSVIWITSPLLFLFSAFYIYSAWWHFQGLQDFNQIIEYLIGIVLGIIYGLLIIYFYLHGKFIKGHVIIPANKLFRYISVISLIGLFIIVFIYFAPESWINFHPTVDDINNSIYEKK